MLRLPLHVDLDSLVGTMQVSDLLGQEGTRAGFAQPEPGHSLPADPSVVVPLRRAVFPKLVSTRGQHLSLPWRAPPDLDPFGAGALAAKYCAIWLSSAFLLSLHFLVSQFATFALPNSSLFHYSVLATTSAVS